MLPLELPEPMLPLELPDVDGDVGEVLVLPPAPALEPDLPKCASHSEREI
jgi:hypothetical protein